MKYFESCTDLAKAIDKLKEGQYTCVLCRGNVMYTSTERGVKPLLDWLDSGRDVKGFSAADKVVGRGAAFLYILLGVEEVYAHVMSTGAIQTLTGKGIGVRYDISAEHIINRAGTGYCPMEEAVSGLKDPEEALTAVRKRLAELNGK